MEDPESQSSQTDAESSEQSSNSYDDDALIGFKNAVAGGVVAALFTGGAKLAVGSIGVWEAQSLLQGTSTTQYWGRAR